MGGGVRARINKKGGLELGRGPDMCQVYCPYDPEITSPERTPCGDWCALFGEPEPEDGKEKVVAIELCHAYHRATDFEDER